MKKNIVIIVLSVVALLLAGTVGYLIAEKTISNKYENGINNNEDNTQHDVESGEDNVVIRELDLSKCLNTTYNYKNAFDKDVISSLSMSVNSDKRSITLNVDFDQLNSVFTIVNGTGIKSYQITGFTKNIVSTFVGGVGQSVSGTVLFYLMEDGTVEYTKITELNYDSQTVSKKSVDNANDIIKLYTADVYADGAGHVSTIGAKSDGSFYDLGEIIMNKKNN